MKNEKFLYTLKDFYPAEYQDNGKWDFTIGLEKDFAKKLIMTLLPKRVIRYLKYDFAETLKIKPSIKFIKSYEKTTYLLESIYLSKPKMGIKIDKEQLKNLKKGTLIQNHIDYHSHNLKEPQQATYILSMWYQWLDRIGRDVLRR